MSSRLQLSSTRRALRYVELTRPLNSSGRTRNSALFQRVNVRFNTTGQPPTNGAATAPPPPSVFTKAKKAAKWSALFCLSSAFGIFAVGGAIFLHDAFTYTHKHIDRVPVDPLALHPELGGPKNLPVARVLVDDEDNEINKKLNKKPKLVIVGGGWGVCCQFLC